MLELETVNGMMVQNKINDIRAAEPGDTREVDRLKKGKIKKKNKSNKSTLEQR